jgi:hypothetical protein
MKRNDKRPEVKLTVDLPSCTLGREDILTLVRRVEDCADWSDHAHMSFELHSVGFSIDASGASQLEDLDWPSPVKRVTAYAHDYADKPRHLFVQLNENSATMTVSAKDAVWARGITATLRDFFATRRNSHSTLRHALTIVAIGLLTWALVVGAVALGLYAAGDFWEGDRALIRFLAPSSIFASWPIVSAWPTIDWLFPHVEFQPLTPPRRFARRLLLGGTGTFLLAVASEFVVAGFLRLL